ncbi:hypothetical protein POM88_014313 [Heracleum sosnowskyi]|uniref:Hcy-binding domain-containing protein n=1 Tax=Heracleum sosnowskyi TaxID=360622 RepID=A0AAD8J055_9APIA|nr:hypothetical protein POM88_014313 [Heracleum sosnowskyi]
MSLVHLDYLEAGAIVIISASYQVRQDSLQGFEARGMSREESEALLKTNVEIACEVRSIYYERAAKGSRDGAEYGNYLEQHPVLIAASVGSYGAYLADGCHGSVGDALDILKLSSLKAQDLDGILPPSLAKLPFIKQIDLTRNYLHGKIPREWASTKLESIAVTVNRLAGPIPDYLGNISALTDLSLDNNMFNGSVPPELGKLVNLKSLHLDANYFTGQLPLELNNLINLQDIRLSRNNFKGKLPNFQFWKQLQKLDIQASGFEGHLPSSISILSNLSDISISNLNGGASEFPQLQRVTQLKNL